MRSARDRAVIIILALGLLVVLMRLLYLNTFDKRFLEGQGDARSIRHLIIPAKRGMITDRNGEPLAVSTNVVAVVVNPKELNDKDPNWAKVIKLLNLDANQVTKDLTAKKNSNFMYLKRQLPPEFANQIQALNVEGVYIQPEYRRYYPDAEVSAQVLGFTSIDNQGQEGLELYYNKWLSGTPGYKNIIRDLKGNAVEQIGDFKGAEDGKPLTLSIDNRIQFLTYHALEKALIKTRALAATAVVMDVNTGEILAMATLPSYNPNNRADMKPQEARNRAVTDVFEPGSTMKPFSAVAILQSGKFTKDSEVDTSPGYITIDGRTIHDVHESGVLTLAGVLQKSSNVGISKFILSIPPHYLLDILPKFGFGQNTGIDFPGESHGVFAKRTTWSQISLASMAFGYGISCTVMQLAQAYAVLADNGVMHQPTLLKQDKALSSKSVIPADLANEVLDMLQSVIEAGGTGTEAKVMGYQIAGKTGTSRKAINGQYVPGHYMGLFAGVAPLSHPRFVMVVMVDDPRGAYFGGSVAAPVFSSVMQQTLRLMMISPDVMPSISTPVTASASKKVSS